MSYAEPLPTFGTTADVRRCLESMRLFLSQREAKLPVDAIVITEQRLEWLRPYYETPSGAPVDPASLYGIPLHVVKNDDAATMKLLSLNTLNRVIVIYDHLDAIEVNIAEARKQVAAMLL
jgi:hypothetical protein